MRKFLPFIFLVLFFSCQNEHQVSTPKFLKIAGETMGTTYHITYEDSLGRNFKEEVDSILVEINQAVSTYIPDSDISKFNQNQEINSFDPYFRDVTLASQKIFQETEGFFDPTVMPLVNYWGFGYTEKKAITEVDSFRVDSLKSLIGFEKIKINCDGTTLGLICGFSKKNPNTQLDFSAIAKGYAVDVVANFFQEKNSKNYLVEIGGELRTLGKNSKGKIWTTAINTPKINAQLNEYEAIIKVKNKAIATSGNYRNFHEVNGEWYGHEINPKTGFPEKSNLLSVTIMADDCMSADAYATAMMVMGLEKSKALTEKLNNIDAFFIFANEAGELETFYTKGFEGTIVE
ncbi:MAG: FAD:protein FMN transferase [Saprospiraceae bacterium]